MVPFAGRKKTVAVVTRIIEKAVITGLESILFAKERSF
jgi:hypothetical protein